MTPVEDDLDWTASVIASTTVCVNRAQRSISEMDGFIRRSQTDLQRSAALLASLVEARTSRRYSAPAGPATDLLKRMEADIHEDRSRPKKKP